MAIGMHSQSGLDDVGYLTSDELLDIRDQPNSLLILGGGPLALELGQFQPNIDGLNLDAAT
jgi:pyruvate/2-oxoglutarate dehydrogenase complex dihydrolipoamide dehydrogenase (E3) component